MWNSTDDRLRRIIWRCNGKYTVKGEKGCESRHIDDNVLYQAFVDIFNMIVENKEYFIGKWQERIESDDALIRYKAKQFIEMMTEAEIINEFDENLYFALVEKVTVFDDGRLVLGLLDGTDVACEIK